MHVHCVFDVQFLFHYTIREQNDPTVYTFINHILYLCVQLCCVVLCCKYTGTTLCHMYPHLYTLCNRRPHLISTNYLKRNVANVFDLLNETAFTLLRTL